MVAYCGLDCLGCECYLATQANDNDKRIEVAKKWALQYKADIRQEHINCDGCRGLEGKKFFHCSVCEMYACNALAKFFEMSPEIKEALEEIRKGVGVMSFQDCIKFANENPASYIATTEGDQPRVRAFLMWFAR